MKHGAGQINQNYRRSFLLFAADDVYEYRHSQLVMNPSSSENTQSIIEDLASINRMERGKLTSEYRTRPDPDGKGEIVRPYSKSYYCG